MQKRQKMQAKLERCVKEKKFLEDVSTKFLISGVAQFVLDDFQK